MGDCVLMPLGSEQHPFLIPCRFPGSSSQLAAGDSDSDSAAARWDRNDPPVRRPTSTPRPRQCLTPHRSSQRDCTEKAYYTRLTVRTLPMVILVRVVSSRHAFCYHHSYREMGGEGIW